MEKEYDILQQYRNISGGLKKRFLKKPNVAEGSEQFGNLAKQLKSQDCPQYAGFCYLAQARCEHTLGNMVAESHLLTEAARSFLQAEQQLFRMNVPSLNEHLNAAINCYSHAIRVHLENGQCPLAANISIELGHALKVCTNELLAIVTSSLLNVACLTSVSTFGRSWQAELLALVAKDGRRNKMRTIVIQAVARNIHNSLGRTDEAIQHYQRAVELQLQTPLDCLVSLGFITSAKISLNDFEGALATLTEMTYFAHERATTVTNTSCQLTGAFTDILANCEVSRVLLLLLLQPTPQRIRPEHAQILEKYSWENRDESTGSSSQQFLSEELFLLMQSVVMACQTNDLRSLKLLQTDLWPLLSAEQNHLLHLVIAELERPSGLE